MTKKQQNVWGYGGIAVLWVTRLSLSLTQDNPEAIQRYHLSSTSLHVLLAALSLPTLLIWNAMFFAALSFYRYARRIIGSEDSRAFRYLTYGLGVNLSGTIITSFISLAQTASNAASSQSFWDRRMLIVVANYVSVAVALVTYWFLLKGANVLLGMVKKTIDRGRIYKRVLLPIVVVAAVYIYLIFANPNRTVSSDPSINPTFALSDLLIVLTVAIPYIIAWLSGLLALVGIRTFQKDTQGIVYKKLFHKLTVGLSMVIALTILLQLVVQFTSFWAGAGLSVILEVIFVLYAILIYAYLLVASGARQLNKLEDAGS